MNYAHQDKADRPKNKSKYSDSKKMEAKNGTKKEFKPPKKISDRYLYNSGLAYLQKFPASSMHFRFIMMRKINKSCRHHIEQDSEKCAEMLDALIVKFIDLGLLDDNAYLKGMVTSLRRRGLSASQIKYKLSQKGYKNDVVAEELNIYDSEEFDDGFIGDQKSALIFARKKRFGPFDTLNKKDFDKSLASMARAGYGYDIAKKTLEMTFEDLPDEFKF